ncbi:hypothetical protein NW249_34595 [Streptomyces sp. OUCMDZ-4982]|uniref:hypothetical protein n=1 Tax=Streptomyces sp. OUCMDZ-4982 TaxID=2973090 RepID=UPI00215CF300|nr:hypothetical protein [Streptomyces sp. OUCMDZ-4982]MCR8947218.1 hypothetical protein [Streptomyces sp. OUCMDZ-4982]
MASTAQILMAYRAELKGGGLPADLVDDLVRDAASTIIMNGGLKVRHPNPTPSTPDPS